MHGNLQPNNPLIIQNLNVNYGSVAAVKEVSFSLQHGEIGCLLGPSGCGKSTLLRAIAGLQKVTAGEIQLGQSLLSTQSKLVATEHRNVGMVFQDIALFPHLSVEKNIRFGLKKCSEAEQVSRTKELLKLIGLEGYEQRYPHSLSGGQQQRVALARALAPRPKLLLMDEPFSGLDATLKETLVPEVRRILLAENITALVVTHDQQEAFTIGDKIALMNHGRLEQFDVPYQIYHQPKTSFAAQFIGQGYFLDAELLNEKQINTDLGIINLTSGTDLNAGDSAKLLIRPDDVIHDDDSSYKAVITGKFFKGTHFQYEVELSNGRKLLCIAYSHHNHALGERVGIRLDLDHVVVYPA